MLTNDFVKSIPLTLEPIDRDALLFKIGYMDRCDASLAFLHMADQHNRALRFIRKMGMQEQFEAFCFANKK